MKVAVGFLSFFLLVTRVTKLFDGCFLSRKTGQETFWPASLSRSAATAFDPILKLISTGKVGCLFPGSDHTAFLFQNVILKGGKKMGI